MHRTSRRTWSDAMVDPKDVVLSDNLEGVLSQLEALCFRHVELRYTFEETEGGFYYADVWEVVHHVCSDGNHGNGVPCEDCDDATRAFARTPLEALKASAQAALRLREAGRGGGV